MEEQVRWDGYGHDRLRALDERPQEFQVTSHPFSDLPPMRALVAELGDVSGKRVLDIGCGIGQLAVYLAKRGAAVVGIDIGPSLIAAAEKLAEVNGVDVDFRVGDAAALPLADGELDAVVGFAILHHLSADDLARAVEETHRVLRPGGVALFVEPVENSVLFDRVQSLVPAGRPGHAYRRPSVLQRAAWKRHLESEDHRALTSAELTRAGEGLFSSVDIEPYGLLSRLERLFAHPIGSRLWTVDAKLLQTFPSAQRFCRLVVARYVR